MPVGGRRRQLLGWLALGGGAAVAELGLLALLHERLGVPLPIASVVAAEALILARFAIADRWVFGHPRPTWGRLLRYHGACAGALVVYLAVFNGLSTLLGVPYAFAFAAGTGASFVWSLITNFLWVWAHPTTAR
jgi:putative flippase GtrA